MSRASRALLASGGLIIAAALAWWWLTFEEVVTYGYLSVGEAGRCLVGNSDICALARALCSSAHPRFVVGYWTSAFWLGVIILSLSLLTIDRPKPAG